jgi:hypothetical protein
MTRHISTVADYLSQVVVVVVVVMVMKAITTQC